MIIIPNKEYDRHFLKRLVWLIFVVALVVFLSLLLMGFFQIDFAQRYISIIALGSLIIFLFFHNFYFEKGHKECDFKFRADYKSIKWKSTSFDKFIGRELLELYQDSEDIFDKGKFPSMSDYSFMLLPIAKVYEGILIKILVRANIINNDKLAIDPNINISAYFNPKGNEKIFGILKDHVRDKSIPHIIYSTYQECRNQIFHHDQFRDNRIDSIEKANIFRKRIMSAIEIAYDKFR